MLPPFRFEQHWWKWGEEFKADLHLTLVAMNYVFTARRRAGPGLTEIRATDSNLLAVCRVDDESEFMVVEAFGSME